MKEFFAMGGYAFFVWTSYGIVAFVMIANVVAAKMKRKRILKQLQELSEES
jgi:heme exporter protein D